MPRRKQGVQMKSHTIRMMDEEWVEMQRCAEIADESDSEYIRIAIKMRNEFRQNGGIGNMLAKEGWTKTEPKEHMIGVEVKNNTVVKTPPMVNTFMKGEKK